MKNITNLAKQYATEILKSNSFDSIHSFIENGYINGFNKCDEFIDMTLLKHPMNTDIIVKTHKGSTYFGKFILIYDNVLFRPDLTKGDEDLKFEYIKEWKNVINK
jgi:hypothetical protein